MIPLNQTFPSMFFRTEGGLFVPPAAGGGTDWTADATMVAHYQFNSSGIRNDSTANNNHVDDATLSEAPAASAGDKIEGDQSADFESSGNDDGCVLSFANASANFPCNGTGDGEITFAGWMKPESIGTTMFLVSLANKQRLGIDTTGHLVGDLNGTGTVTQTTTATVSTATWYLVAFVYSDSANETRIYIRAQGGGSSTWETQAATVGTLDDATGDNFCLGCRIDSTSALCFDGLMDDWAIFNGKAFTQAELDSVFANGWDGNGW